ncbi:STAS domain-containing protein [Nonomuraea polychroma]|uniref:STAS domain-containing protein n=1 Tax=Nonomuraea polychroma TaxID=46176 RepID=UPI003D900843
MRVDDYEGISVLHVDGELDLATEHIFRRACDQLLARGHAKIVVDVGGLSFCDCTGLGAFIAAQQQAEWRGGYLRLVGVRRQLAKLLRLAQLVDTFPPYTDLRHACG